MSTGKNETELSCMLHAFLNIPYQRSSSMPWKPTGLGVEGLSWLGPPALILDWVGIAGSWGGKQLAWWWLRGIGKAEWASLISMKSTGGEMAWPRQVMVGGSRGRLSCIRGSGLSHAAMTVFRWAATANTLAWNKVWQTRAFPVICAWCQCVQQNASNEPKGGCVQEWHECI